MAPKPELQDSYIRDLWRRYNPLEGRDDHADLVLALIRKLICREPETLLMVIGAISSRIRYGRMGFLKMSGTLRFMRTASLSRTTKPDLGRFKTPTMLACIWRQEKRSKQRNDQDVFSIFFQKLRTPCTVSAPFDPPDNYVSKDKSDYRGCCKRHCDRDEEIE